MCVCVCVCVYGGGVGQGAENWSKMLNSYKKDVRFIKKRSWIYKKKSAKFVKRNIFSFWSFVHTYFLSGHLCTIFSELTASLTYLESSRKSVDIHAR